MPKFFKLTAAYDGTDFSGWQRQAGRRTVQQAIEDAWQKITGETISITASGRTDAGVHAAGQVIGVVSETHLSCTQLASALNACLPDDVVVQRVEPAPDRFHATVDARQKRYRYMIHNGRTPPLFDRRYVWHVPRPLDTQAMHKAGQTLVGKHDFKSFESAGSPRASTVRTIFALAVLRGATPLVGSDAEGQRIAIDIVGDGFLYNMVRTIVGTLVRVGQGRQDAAWVRQVLEARDRRAAGPTAPARGLTLAEVDYGKVDRSNHSGSRILPFGLH